VIGGHDGGVKCLQFTSELLVTGSDDKTIKIFDVRTGKYIKTIKGISANTLTHPPSIDHSPLMPCRVVLRVSCVVCRWSLSTSVPCGGSISCLQFQDDVLCTASKREKAIYTFDLRRSNHYQRVLEAHSKAVRHRTHRIPHKPQTPSGGLRVLRLTCAVSLGRHTTHTTHTHTHTRHTQVYCLQFDLATNRLVSGARDRQIFVWDFEKGEVIKKLSGHRYALIPPPRLFALSFHHSPHLHLDTRS
jgi:WD40 repeat protein